MKKIIALTLMMAMPLLAESTSYLSEEDKGFLLLSEIPPSTKPVQKRIRTKDDLHKDLDKLFDIDKVEDRRANVIDQINRLPATSAGASSKESCKYARHVLKGKLMKFDQLKLDGFTRAEFRMARMDVDEWESKVASYCR